MREDTPAPPTRAGLQSAEELRAEVDRLRRVNQELLEQIEDVRSPARALAWHGKRAWRAAWQQYYVARWKLLHARDPKQGLRPRDQRDPYVARMRHPVLSERRRVMHFIGNFHTGGSAQLIVDLVEHLGHRYEQKVVVRSLPPAPAYTGVDLVHREWRSGPRAMLRELRAFQPELVHVHMLGHQYDEYGKRDWSWYHDVFRAVEAYGAPCIENVNIPVEPYLSSAVRCYVHVSDYVRERFGQLDSWNETIYPGSDLDLFDRPSEAPIPDDHIGMIYRLQPDKLDERSIEPFIEVARRRPGTRVSIVGGGQYLELYQQRVAAAGVTDAFTFTGYLPFVDLPAQLARMSIFVAPVHTESFGQVSPFAMGMGIPVVGYDVGALREITAAPELLAPAGDASALADIVISLLDDRERRLRIGEENRHRARARFSVEAMVGRYESLYEDMLTAPRRPRLARSAAPAEGGYRGRSVEVPTVSVVMAVHNGERFLREAIESVLNQTFGSFELLVVDDASSDGTRAILATYRDRRIRVLVNDRQRGLSYSLNRGIGEARGRYIARLDADDVAEPERFAAQVEYLDRRGDVALLGSWYSVIDARGREIGRRWVPGDHHEIRWMLGFCNAFAHSAVMIRRTVLDEVGLYDESLVYAMDYDLWVRIAERKRVANYEKFLLRWRTHPHSLTTALGDRTEMFDHVAGELGRRLDWSGFSAAERERRAGLLIGIVAGSPDDMSIEDARWAVDALFTLHRLYCAEHATPGFPEKGLWQNLRRNVARALLWMGHRYPDRRDARYARSTLALAARVDRKVLVSREAASLVAKLIGGRATTSIIRLLAHRVGRG